MTLVLRTTDMSFQACCMRRNQAQNCIRSDAVRHHTTRFTTLQIVLTSWRNEAVTRAYKNLITTAQLSTDLGHLSKCPRQPPMWRSSSPMQATSRDSKLYISVNVGALIIGTGFLGCILL